MSGDPVRSKHTLDVITGKHKGVGEPVMVSYEAFVSRHGEDMTQMMLEDLERFLKIDTGSVVLPLKERWMRLIEGKEAAPATQYEAWDY